ncbi:MAG: hypothetical protein J6E38_06915 [Clostridia bacterium]|nr:hypothetical protein [Clostridia bacterium]
MNIIRIISIALSSLTVLILLRRLNNEYATITSCFISIFICVFSFGILIPVFDFIKKLGSSETLGNLYTLMIKSAGVCMLCSVASEMCSECGEGSIGAKIEFAGNCTLIVLGLPLIESVFENATKFIY